MIISNNTWQLSHGTHYRIFICLAIVCSLWVVINSVWLWYFSNISNARAREREKLIRKSRTLSLYIFCCSCQWCYKYQWPLKLIVYFFCHLFCSFTFKWSDTFLAANSTPQIRRCIESLFIEYDEHESAGQSKCCVVAVFHFHR